MHVHIFRSVPVLISNERKRILESMGFEPAPFISLKENEQEMHLCSKNASCISHHCPKLSVVLSTLIHAPIFMGSLGQPA
jgi:hypothetical protein